jgi:hypothetical protein
MKIMNADKSNKDWKDYTVGEGACQGMLKDERMAIHPNNISHNRKPSPPLDELFTGLCVSEK